MVYDEQIKTQVTFIDDKEKAAVNKFFSQMNSVLLPSFGKGVDVGAYLADKEKALSGAGTATGSGLLQINYQAQISSMSPVGGSYRASGVQVQDNISGTSAQFVSYFGGADDKFGDLTSGSTSSQDSTGTFYTQSFPFSQNIYRVPVYKSVLQGILSSPQAIIDLYANDYSRDVLKLEDRKTTVAILSDTNVAGTAKVVAAQGSTSLTLLALKQKLIANGALNVAFALNAIQWQTLKSEQDSTGQFIRNVDSRITFLIEGKGILAGLVGYLDGSPIYLNHGIKNTYTKTGNNFLAATGGSNTALIAYDPQQIGIANGINYLEGFRVFEDTATYDQGIIALRGQHNLASGAINPNGVAYSMI